MSEQPRYLEKAKQTYKFHREQVLSHNEWTIAATAKALRCSFGNVAEDLLIARWSKTHENQLMKFSYRYEALKFIKEKQKEQNLDEIE